MSRDVVIVDAVRTPIGRRDGTLRSVHSADMLGKTQRALFERTGLDPEEVGQVVGGCVDQIGMQSFNITRTAWLTAGLPLSVPASTVDAQCGSSQQATNLAYALISSSVTDVAVACGVENMSAVPIGSPRAKPLNLGVGIPKSYFSQYEYTSQFEAAERIADKWGIDRAAADEFGLRSQELAAKAWKEDRFATQIITIEAENLDEDGRSLGTTISFTRDEVLRDTSLDLLATLKPVGREDGVHTAGSSSQIADGAASVLMMTAEKADELGLIPKARIIDSCLVGVDPVMMLTGPIDASQRLFERNKLTLGDIDVVEINEAFASVVLAWAREMGSDLGGVNPNGGAIAMGHPLGATGAILMTKAVHELDRADQELALVTMCCGGGLGTGTLIERLN